MPTPALTTHTLDIRQAQIDQETFFRLCQVHREERLERTAAGEIIMMSPGGGSAAFRNNELFFQLTLWAKKDGRGQVFDSSGGFVLPNGATRSPDASWVENERLAKLTEEERHRFLPLCPTLVVELRSPSDELHTLKAKLEEYRATGARLGWLIDPTTAKVSIYRPGRKVEVLRRPEVLLGDPELVGLAVGMGRIWNLGW